MEWLEFKDYIPFFKRKTITKVHPKRDLGLKSKDGCEVYLSPTGLYAISSDKLRNKKCEVIRQVGETKETVLVETSLTSSLDRPLRRVLGFQQGNWWKT